MLLFIYSFAVQKTNEKGKRVKEQMKTLENERPSSGAEKSRKNTEVNADKFNTKTARVIERKLDCISEMT